MRASSSLRSGSTLRATSAGLKSLIFSNTSSTESMPSPVSVLGTLNAARGFIAFIRLSKLSMSNSRNFRSATLPLGTSDLPERSDITPITKGNCTFFVAP